MTDYLIMKTIGLAELVNLLRVSYRTLVMYYILESISKFSLELSDENIRNSKEMNSLVLSVIHLLN